MKQFRWVPGSGIDATAIGRMMKHLKLPTEPMGEAWFMGSERVMYKDALRVPCEKLPYEQSQKMLEEIGSGITCFGPMEEWTEWLHYFLPRVIQQPVERDPLDYPAELLFTALFAQYPTQLGPEPYRGFKQDVLETVGQAIMSPSLWEHGRLRVGSGLINKSRRHGEEWWYLNEANPMLSASLFFVLKYVASDAVEP